MTRNEQEMYSNIGSIAKSLEKIAKSLESNKTETTKDIPGFEGVLNDLDNLYQPNDPYNSDYTSTRKAILEQQALSDKCLAANCDGDECTHNDYDDDIHNDFLNDLVQNMNHIEYLNFHHDMAFGFASSDTAALNDHIYELEYEECLDAIQRALLITGDEDYVSAVASTGGIASDVAGRNFVIETLKEKSYDKYADDPNLEVQMNQDEPYEYDLQGIRVDSDHDIRTTAAYYEDEELANGATKKSCILDYVTNEFGSHGARYTDIIKFAYYLGSSNAPKYTSANRGYYACAFSPRMDGFLIQGGKDYFVKGINKEGKERYFALSFVESATDYWKRIG